MIFFFNIPIFIDIYLVKEDKKSILCVNIQFFTENMKMKRKRDKKIWPSQTGIWNPDLWKGPVHNSNFEGD